MNFATMIECQALPALTVLAQADLKFLSVVTSKPTNCLGVKVQDVFVMVVSFVGSHLDRVISRRSIVAEIIHESDVDVRMIMIRPGIRR